MIGEVMQSAALVLGSWVTVFALSGILTGCGDSCEDLQEICDRCTDADYAQSCDSTVTQGNQSLCDARKTSFNAQCPFVLDASTTTTAAASGGAGGTSTGGTGGTTSTGGTGGTTATGGTGGVGGTASTGGAGGTGGTGGTGGA